MVQEGFIVCLVLSRPRRRRGEEVVCSEQKVSEVGRREKRRGKRSIYHSPASAWTACSHTVDRGPLGLASMVGARRAAGGSRRGSRRPLCYKFERQDVLRGPVDWDLVVEDRHPRVSVAWVWEERGGRSQEVPAARSAQTDPSDSKRGDESSVNAWGR